MSFSLASWSSAGRAALDTYLATAFTDAWPAGFAEPARYPLFGGGKRVRPLLTFAAHRAVAGDTPLDAAMPSAAAVEMVHTYSLVHDDLPAMDDDDERRGRPTVHRAFDEATAILAGDALLTEAFRVLAQADAPPHRTVMLVSRLAQASGYLGMIGGQVADIGGVDTYDDLTRLHRLKTGALIQAACWMGGVSAGADTMQLAALDAYGSAVGLAFQLADDVLDAEEDAQQGGPPSFVKLLGTAETQRRAAELCDEALGLANQFPNPDALAALARFIVERDV